MSAAVAVVVVVVAVSLSKERKKKNALFNLGTALCALCRVSTKVGFLVKSKEREDGAN